MSTRTTYTATVKVPIYVAWKCEDCGKINFSEGTISCQRHASTTSFRSKKHNAASKKASELVKEAWKEEVLDFIMLPTYNTEKLMHDLEINNKAKCSHCNKKAVWNISTVYDYCTGITLLTGLISGLVSFSTGASITSWLIFILSIGIFLWAGISWLICNRKAKHLPEEYVPVIGSFNYKLNEYAQSKNVFLPSPDEAIFLVNDVFNESAVACPSCGAQLLENAMFCNKCGTKYESEAKTDSKKAEKSFCRKCGEELFADSEFCHKCGTKIIKKEVLK